MAITAGTYTIGQAGSGADYETVMQAFYDISKTGITGNINFDVIDDCLMYPPTWVDPFWYNGINIKNYTITLNTPVYHNGYFGSHSPTIYIGDAYCTINRDTMFYFSVNTTDAAKFIVSNCKFKIKHTSKTPTYNNSGAISTYNSNVNNNFMCLIYNNLIDSSERFVGSLSYTNGINMQYGIGKKYVYRNIVYDSTSRVSAIRIGTGTAFIENNTFVGVLAPINITGGTSPTIQLCNNLVYSTNNAIITNTTWYNNASNKAFTGFAGADNLGSLALNVAGDEFFESYDMLSPDFLKLKKGTVLTTSGISTGLYTGNTTGIRSNASPNAIIGMSIGADQFEPTYALTADDYFKRYQPYRSEELRNYISIYSRQYAVNTTIEEVGSLDIAIGGGETETYEIEYADVPCKNLYISLESGEYDDETTTYEPYTDCEIISSNLYPCYSTATIKNNASGTVKIKIVIFGSKIYIRSNKATNAIDQTSIDKYGKKEFKIDNNHLIQDPAHSQILADRLLASYKDPRKDQQLEWRGDPALELGDIVELPEYRRQGQDIKGEYWVTKNQLNYDGTLRANTEYRKKVE